MSVRVKEVAAAGVSGVVDAPNIRRRGTVRARCVGATAGEDAAQHIAVHIISQFRKL